MWPFELLDKLGEGGMGVVYRARYVGNNRMVAVKLVPEEVARDATLVARFEREMEVLKELRHPHVVHCFGGSCEGNQRFYAMELVEGGTLAAMLEEQRRLPWEQVVHFGQQMCAGLACAHERGVIHRDIKPGNFLITKSGKLKLADFGLATMTSANRLTATGRTMGTFHYMAPEQIRGKPALGPRTDLYALGCVLFELLTGRPPFDGENPAEVLHKHLKEIPSRVASELISIPAALDELIAELLEKEMTLRPESALVVANRLEEIELEPHGSGKLPAITPAAGTPLRSKSSRSPATQKGGTPPSAVSPVSFSLENLIQPQRSPWLVRLLSISVIGLFLGLMLLWSSSSELARKVRRAEDYWISRLSASDPTARDQAVAGLQQISPLTPGSIKRLTELLSQPNVAARGAASSALGAQPGLPNEVVAELTKLRKQDDSPIVRHAAAEALKASSQLRPPGVISGWFWVVIGLVPLALLVWGLRQVWLAFRPTAHAKPRSRVT